jgi:hypothetical protein
MAGVTGQQEMFTPPWHLIPLLVFPGIHVSLIFTGIIPLSELDTDFDCRFFRLPDLGVLILTVDFVLFTWFGHTDFDN